MATNKAAIVAKINEIQTGVLNPASRVRDVLKDSTDSILASVYGDSVVETKDTESILTTNSANLTFVASIYKVGRNVTITGRIRNEGTVFIAPLMNITDNDYKPKEDITFYGNGFISNSSEGLSVTALNITTPIPICRLSFNNILGADEAINFTISYPSNI